MFTKKFIDLEKKLQSFEMYILYVKETFLQWLINLVMGPRNNLISYFKFPIGITHVFMTRDCNSF